MLHLLENYNYEENQLIVCQNASLNTLVMVADL